MPRPDLTPAYLERLEKHYKEFHENPPPDHRPCPPEFEEQYKEMFMAGDWLGHRLSESGAEEKEIESICFAFGQRCMGSPDVWETAKEQLLKYWQGKADKPGMKLAEEITAHVFGGEMADHIERRKQRRAAMYEKYSKFVD